MLASPISRDKRPAAGIGWPRPFRGSPGRSANSVVSPVSPLSVRAGRGYVDARSEAIWTPLTVERSRSVAMEPRGGKRGAVGITSFFWNNVF